MKQREKLGNSASQLSLLCGSGHIPHTKKKSINQLKKKKKRRLRRKKIKSQRWREEERAQHKLQWVGNSSVLASPGFTGCHPFISRISTDTSVSVIFIQHGGLTACLRMKLIGATDAARRDSVSVRACWSERRMCPVHPRKCPHIEHVPCHRDIVPSAPLFQSLSCANGQWPIFYSAANQIVPC